MDILLLSSLDNILFRFRGLSLDCLNFSCLNKMDNKFNKDFTNSGVLVLLGGDFVWESLQVSGKLKSFCCKFVHWVEGSAHKLAKREQNKESFPVWTACAN